MILYPPSVPDTKFGPGAGNYDTPIAFFVQLDLNV